MTEIMAAVVMFVMRYEVLPGGGHLTAPTVHNTNIAAFVMELDSETEVEVRSRKGF
ncbi:MAG: hypothetical protein M1837_003451 [Sclerophora amabilis]|nr:MAG: hypothetical protein M1837_003451 [Sclerophora amabilis]